MQELYDVKNHLIYYVSVMKQKRR